MRDRLAHALAEERGEQIAAWLQQPMYLQQPAGPVIGQMREHGGRPCEVERLVLVRQPGPLAADDCMHRREMLVQPLDARRVDVAALELRGRRLVEEVAHRATAPQPKSRLRLPAHVQSSGRSRSISRRIAAPSATYA